MSAHAPEQSGDLIEILCVRPGIVCLVGAGGKKSTMYQIASRFPGRIAVTATVHTPPFRKRLSGPTLVAPNEQLKTLVAGRSGAGIVAYACPSDKKARLAGVAPDVVVDIHEACGFDLTLVKADGARLRRIKAPGPREPVLPARCTTLIPLVSVRAVGQPLDHGVAHRPELLAGLVGAQPGERITPDHVARLLAHPRGGMKHADRVEVVVPVINMVDTDEQQHTARLIAVRLLESTTCVDRVLLARMASENPVVEVVTR